MKARNLTVLAVVASGALALAAPSAFAVDAQGAKKSKSDSRQDKDIKRLSDNVNGLRKADDETNGRITAIVDGLTPVLTKLGDAATSYANFEYGAAQMTLNGAPYGPGFMVTSRIEPTAQQATVTKQFACLTGTGLSCPTGSKIGFKVVVRSVDPEGNAKKSTPACTVTASQDTGSGAAGNEKWGVTIPSDAAINAQVPFYGVNRVWLPPKDKAEKTASPFSMVASEFGEGRAFLAANGNSTGTGDNIGPINAGNFAVTNAADGGGLITATLSCLAVPID